MTATMQHDDPLMLRIADALDHMRQEVENLGAALCSDPALVTAHFTALQSLDRIGQQQQALAKVLRASDRPSAIAAVGLDDLRGWLLDERGD